MLDVASGATWNGANVQIYSSNATGAQRWRVTHDEDGFVIIAGVGSGKALDVAAGQSKAGANVQIFDANGTAAQKWIAIPDGDAFKLVSALDGNLVLDVAAGSTQDGANVQIYTDNGTTAQRFSFISTDAEVEPCEDILPDGWFSLSPASVPGQAVDIAAASSSNGANAQVYAANQTLAQLFEFVYADGFYLVRNAASGKVLDVAGGDVVPGANVQQWDGSAANPNQLFSAVENDDGTWSLVNKATGLFLAVDGSNLVVSGDGGAASRFTLTEQVNLLAQGIYAIEAASDTSFVLDLASASTSDAAAIQLYRSNGTFAQRWYIAPVEGKDNTYTIESLSSAKYLTATGQNAVAQRSAANDASQQWVPVLRGGSVAFVSAAHPNRALSFGQAANGSALVLSDYSAGSANQGFKLVSTSPVLADGTYFVRSVLNPGAVLDVANGSSSSGANVQIFQNNGSGAQKWNIARNGDGSYTVVNAASGKALDVSAGQAVSGANVQQYAKNGSDAQKWYISFAAGGWKLTSKLSSSLVLDINGGSTSNGSNVQIYADNGSAAQRFTFEQTTYVPPVHYHNIAWIGQPNNYYCGPTSGTMILRNVGANYSASGRALSVYAVADYMGTNAVGFTSFNNRAFQNGMNSWLGKDVYTTIANPSYDTTRSYLLRSYENGYAMALDAHERRGGPHYNGHSNTTFSHITVIDGYNEQTDQALFVDPATTLFSNASQKFWYPLRTFVANFLKPAVWRDGIGIYAAK